MSSIKAEGDGVVVPEGFGAREDASLDMEQGNPRAAAGSRRRSCTSTASTGSPTPINGTTTRPTPCCSGPAGAERTFDVVDPDAVGGKRRQTWRFSGRAECQRCHNKWSGPPLGFNTAQLNKDHDYGGMPASQLDTFAHIRLIDRPIPAENRPRLARPGDPSASLDGRARSYLHVNCSHCHRMHAGSAVLSKMTYDLPLDKTDMVGVRPTQGTFGIHDAQVIAPGDPFRSVLLYRMSKLGSGRMPHIGSTEVDRDGVDLLFEWVSRMPKPAPADEPASKRREAELADLERLRHDDRPEGRAEVIDRLLTSTSAAWMLMRSIDDKTLPSSAASLVIEKGARHDEVSVRDLFERFLPADQRVKRLGSLVQAEQLLSLPGDAARGKQVFFKTAGVQCKNCHRVGQDGTEVGPDLTTIGEKYNRAQLLESILEPSKLIDPKYVTYLAETKDGRVLSGLLAERDEKEVVLKDAQNKVLRLPVSDVEQLVTQQQSLMPELLLRDMTAQQVADLLEYLGSLK